MSFALIPEGQVGRYIHSASPLRLELPSSAVFPTYSHLTLSFKFVRILGRHIIIYSRSRAAQYVARRYDEDCEGPRGFIKHCINATD